MRLALAIALALTGAVGAVGAPQAIDVRLDKKVIYADSLNLAPSTDVATILALLPELLERPGGSAIAT